MFWIFDQNSFDRIDMFELLLSSACTVPRSFFVSHSVPPMSRLWVHKRLGGDTAGTTDPS